MYLMIAPLVITQREKYNRDSITLKADFHTSLGGNLISREYEIGDRRPPSYIFCPPPWGMRCRQTSLAYPSGRIMLHLFSLSAPPARTTGMPIPPIVRLSQALYTDVPSPAPGRSCRKRSHASNSGTSDTVAASAQQPRPAVVRLLLPPTFAVADRAYHDSVTALVGRKKAPERIAGDGATGSASCDGDADSVVPPHLGVDGALLEEHDGSGSGSYSRQRQPSSSSQSATRGGAVLIVVESVLGFSAVCNLLDRSHAALASAAGDITKVEKPPLGDSVCRCAGQDSAASDDSDRGAVSEAVSRLVGWLRVAAARTNLPSDGNSNSSITTRRRTQNAGFAFSLDVDLDDDELLLTAANVQAHGTLYGVRGQREAGAEWRVFDLEPKDPGASGMDAYRPLRHGRGLCVQQIPAVQV